MEKEHDENDDDTNDYSGLKEFFKKSRERAEEYNRLEKMKKTKKELNLLAGNIAALKIQQKNHFEETKKVLMKKTKEELVSTVISLTTIIYYKDKK